MDQKAPDGSARASASLEAEVMAVLWTAEGPLSPGDVRQLLARERAYTTVMTTLVRLFDKGLLDRHRVGRAYEYSPRQRAEEHAAQSMSEMLAGSRDTRAVLSRFVDRLDPGQEQMLRQLLDGSAESGAN